MREASDKSTTLAQIKKLAGGLCNGTLTEQEHHELAELLEKDASARRSYLNYMLVHVKLMEKVSIESPSDSVDLDVNLDSACLSTPAIRESEAWTAQNHLWKWVGAIAALVSFVLAYQAWNGNSTRLATQLQKPQPSFDDSSVDVKSMVESPQQAAATHVENDAPFFVAQISGISSNVRWGNSSRFHEFLLRVRRGDRLELHEGEVELSYYSGARILLQGPCVFVPTGRSAGRLLDGELTGHVSDGNFTLTTPTAEVIDLGTEFGVALDTHGNSEVSVFDGEVRVSDLTLSGSPGTSLLLKKGMSVRVDRNSGITPLSVPERTGKVRSLPTNTTAPNDLSLVDILSGPIGDRFKLAGVIAADTGEPDSHPWMRETGPGHSVSNGYQLTTWHPLVDGVFIPAKPGGSTLLDSAQHTVKLPSSTETTWGPIWSRRRIAGVPTVASKDDYWGTGTLEVVIARLEKSQTGMIGMHANVGITFDLEAIRLSFGQSPASFQGILSNLDNSAQYVDDRAWVESHRFSADFRIFVDGELRESRLDFRRADGEYQFKVPLKPHDKYLTLVSSDAGELASSFPKYQVAFDHVVLIDPVLTVSAD